MAKIIGKLTQTELKARIIRLTEQRAKFKGKPNKAILIPHMEKLLGTYKRRLKKLQSTKGKGNGKRKTAKQKTAHR